MVCLTLLRMFGVTREYDTAETRDLWPLTRTIIQIIGLLEPVTDISVVTALTLVCYAAGRYMYVLAGAVTFIVYIQYILCPVVTLCVAKAVYRYNREQRLQTDDNNARIGSQANNDYRFLQNLILSLLTNHYV